MKRILNVGCGNETYGTHFIDLYPTRKEVIKLDVNFEKFPFPSNYFDEVYSRCLFEHLKNPLNFLKESYRVLKRKGKIVIITDNANWIGYIFSPLHHGGYEKESFAEDKHFALFTPNHLKNWLECCGFKVESVQYMFFNKEFTKSRIKAWITKIFCFILSKINERMAYPWIKIVGEKP